MVNLITPCVSMSFLTILVFSLSSNSGEKITLCISILLALTLFFLLLLDIMPPTSLVVPLLGKYLVFTITMVSLSICVTIYILNIHYRTPELYGEMPPLIRKIFLVYMPQLLFLKNLDEEEDNYRKFRKQRSMSAFGDQNNKIKSDDSQAPENPLLTEAKLKLDDIKQEYSRENDLILLVDNQMTAILAADNHNRVIREQLARMEKKKIHAAKLKELNRLYSSNGMLAKQNLNYLIEIADFVKRESNKRRVRSRLKNFRFILFKTNCYFIHLDRPRMETFGSCARSHTALYIRNGLRIWHLAYFLASAFT